MHLDTPRLYLREQELDDAAAAHDYERRAEVMRYQTGDVRTLEESRAYIARVREDSAREPRHLYDLAIVLRDPGRFVGRVGLFVSDPAAREARCWYVLHPDVWGQGLAVEALRAVLDHGFRALDLHRVVADIDPRNTASVRVVEKLGLRREAHFVENAYLKGEWCDSLIYAVLDREWR